MKPDFDVNIIMVCLSVCLFQCGTLIGMSGTYCGHWAQIVTDTNLTSPPPSSPLLNIHCLTPRLVCLFAFYLIDKSLKQIAHNRNIDKSRKVMLDPDKKRNVSVWVDEF